MPHPADDGISKPVQPAATPAQTAAPAATDYTAQTWAVALLQELGKQLGKNLDTPQNRAAIVAWEAAEGGNWNNSAAYNPLNTKQGMPGSHGMPNAANSDAAGVQAYTSWQQGIDATVKTMLNGNYGGLLSALTAGNDPGGVANAVVNSKWGTKTINLSEGQTYNPSGEPGVGGTFSAVGTNPTGSTQLTQASFEQGLLSSGFAVGLLNSVPELKKIWQNAVQKQMWNSDTGQQEFLNQVESSTWYKQHTESQRRIEDMKFSDPAQYNRLLTQQQADLRVQAAQMGVNLDPATLRSMAEGAVYNGLDASEIASGLASHFTYLGGNQSPTGQAGLDVNQIKDLAAQYGVKADPTQIQSQVQRLLAGSLSADTLTESYKNQALSQYPYLKQQLDSGLTVKDVASPYMQEMGDLLEVDPNSLTLSDPTVLKGLQQKNSDGTFSLMPMYEYQQMLRQDPRWLQTNNAKNSLMDLTSSFLNKMGLVAS